MTDSANVGVNTLRAQVFTGGFHKFSTMKGSFSPTTSTLLTGPTEAVLIDAQHIRTDVAAIGDLIAQTGRRLTTIYITHGHADHWYGLSELRARFPGARAVATAAVVEHIKDTAEEVAEQWSVMFGDRAVDPTTVPEVLQGSRIEVDGAELHVVEVGQGDIAHSTVVHAPAIDTVITGDVIYNQIHVMLGFGGPPEWERWLQSVDTIEALSPRVLVAGHKRPDSSDVEVDRILDETRSYIIDFAEIAHTTDTADELIDVMKSKYPDFGNPWTLWYSAHAWINNRTA